MTQDGLEFQPFYEHVYALLGSFEFMFSNSRSTKRFLTLLENVLSSSLLPTYVLGSFVKRIARVSLVAPSHVVLVLLHLTYNVIRRNPSLVVLIHNPTHKPYVDGLLSSNDEKMNEAQERNRILEIQKKSILIAKGVTDSTQSFKEKNVSLKQDDPKWADPFDDAEPDVKKTNAMMSSLWELGVLERHVDPRVRRVAKELFATQLVDDVKTKPTERADRRIENCDYAASFRGLVGGDHVRKKKRKNAEIAFVHVRPTQLL